MRFGTTSTDSFTGAFDESEWPGLKDFPREIGVGSLAAAASENTQRDLLHSTHDRRLDMLAGILQDAHHLVLRSGGGGGAFQYAMSSSQRKENLRRIIMMIIAAGARRHSIQEELDLALDQSDI